MKGKGDGILAASRPNPKTCCYCWISLKLTVSALTLECPQVKWCLSQVLLQPILPHTFSKLLYMWVKTSWILATKLCLSSNNIRSWTTLLQIPKYLKCTGYFKVLGSREVCQAALVTEFSTGPWQKENKADVLKLPSLRLKELECPAHHP